MCSAINAPSVITAKRNRRRMTPLRSDFHERRQPEITLGDARMRKLEPAAPHQSVVVEQIEIKRPRPPAQAAATPGLASGHHRMSNPPHQDRKCPTARLAVGGVGAAKRIDVVAACITAGFDVHQILDIDFGYAPPMSPLWDPIAVAARRALSLLS